MAKVIRTNDPFVASSLEVITLIHIPRMGIGQSTPKKVLPQMRQGINAQPTRGCEGWW